MEGEVLTIEERKKYLCRYLAACRQEKLLLLQIKELRDRRTSPKSLGDGMPRTRAVADLSNYAAKWDELERELEVERMAEAQLYTDILKRVKAVPDEIEREILTRRYLLGQGWEQIATEMGYSYRHITKLHGFALKKLAV